MIAPGPLNATVALRKPDGAPFDQADADGLLPSTLLVIEVDARATAGADGEPVVTLGRVIGWVPPIHAPFGRTMLTGACVAVNAAAAELAKPKAAGA